MQNIFSISKRWHDPVLSTTRATILILTVLALESFVFLIKRIFPYSPIYLLGLLRAADLVILLILGTWNFKGPKIKSEIKDALFVTLLFAGAGLVFLIFWKHILGASMLKLNSNASFQNGAVLSAFYVTSCLLSPAVEEFIFRGILYRKIREKWNVWISIGIISLLFALIHWFFNGNALFPFLGSLIFCIGYEKTKSILTPILLHIAGNIIIFCSPYISFI